MPPRLGGPWVPTTDQKALRFAIEEIAVMRTLRAKRTFCAALLRSAFGAWLMAMAFVGIVVWLAMSHALSKDEDVGPHTIPAGHPQKGGLTSAWNHATPSA